MKTIYESILDDEDDVMDAIGQTTLTDWMKNHVKGKYKMMLLKNGTYKVWGDMYIRNCKDETVPAGLQFSFFEGTLSISNCGFRSLEGLFSQHIGKILSLTININNCDNLLNLLGLPWAIEGDLNIANNKSLKDLNGIPEFIQGDVNLMKNGKRFKEEYVRRMVKDSDKTFGKIYCNLNNEEPLVNEALSEPHLYRLSKQLDELAQHQKNNGLQFYRLMKYRYSAIKWDKITSEYVTVYKNIDKKALTAARKLISGSGAGLILLMNSEDKYTHIISDKKTMFSFEPRYYERYDWYNKKTTELIDVISSAWKMIIIELPWNSSEDSVLEPVNAWQLQTDRAAAKQGVIPVGLSDREYRNYYRELARENKRRYEAILTKMRAERDSNIDKIGEAVGKILERFVKLNMKAQMGKIQIESYWLDDLNEKIYGQRVYTGYNRRGGSSYTGKDGIVYMYSKFSETYLKIKSSKDNDAQIYKESFKRYKENLEKIIKECDTAFTQYGV